MNCWAAVELVRRNGKLIEVSFSFLFFSSRCACARAGLLGSCCKFPKLFFCGLLFVIYTLGSPRVCTREEPPLGVTAVWKVFFLFCGSARFALPFSSVSRSCAAVAVAAVAA